MKTLIASAVIFIAGCFAGAFVEKSSNNSKLIEQQQLLIKQQEIIKNLEIKHAEKEREIVKEFEKAKQDYENTIHSITSANSDSLRKHEERANYYRQEYQQCNKLVERAIQLDRAITQGIGLVEELEEFIRLEQFINDLNRKIINNDRDLINSR